MKLSRYKWLAVVCLLALLFVAFASPGLTPLATLVIPVWVFFAALLLFQVQLGAAVESCCPQPAALLPIRSPRPPPFR